MKFPPSRNQLESFLTGILVFEICTVTLCVLTALASGVMADDIYQAEPTSYDLLIGIAALFLCLVYFPGSIIAWIGLFRRRWWSRWLYVGMLVTSNALDLVIGLVDWSFQWGLPGAIAVVCGITSGIVSSIIFLTPVAESFTKPTLNMENDVHQTLSPASLSALKRL